MSKFGRPKKKGKLSTFSQKSFWLNNSLSDVWKEYVKISKKLITVSSIFPQRCPQIQLKFLVLECVRQNTEDLAMKQKIDNYLQSEEERFEKMIENSKKKPKVESTKTISAKEEIEEEEIEEKESDEEEDKYVIKDEEDYK